MDECVRVGWIDGVVVVVVVNNRLTIFVFCESLNSRGRSFSCFPYPNLKTTLFVFSMFE